MSFSAVAAGWTQGAGENSQRWWFDLGNGQYYAGDSQNTEWQWLDGNGDGVAECYAFDPAGWMYAAGTTPDGYTVDESGAWTVNGAVQTMAVTPGYAGTGRQSETDRRILIAYFSKTGNTEEAAREIQNVTGGDLFEITVSDPYPENYQRTLERATQELESNARPQLAAAVENMEDYDVILLGYPIWLSQAPMAVHSFLESYDLTGKTILPFCTSGGSRIEGSMASIRQTASARGASVGTGLTANSLGEAAIAQWLGENGITL